MLRLRIELLSPLCTGSGVGRPGFVDRDVVYDSCGLPILPARRLKGLLLDAYRGILASKAVEGKGLPESDRVFGAPGATDSDNNKRAGLFQLGSADLADSLELVPWLSSVTTRQASPIVRDDVTAIFTDIRHQTKIDRRFGRAEDDTLRATRTILSGLVFFAPVGGLPEEADRKALALAAAGVQEMGTSRSRGFGKVKCKLEERRGDAWHDLSEPAIRWLASEDAIDRSARPEQERRTDAAAQHTGDLHRLRYRLMLTAPAVIPKLAGDPFTVFTEHYVPGSTIRGVLAARYLASNKPDGRFYQLLCGHVRFLPATAAGTSTLQVTVTDTDNDTKSGSFTLSVVAGAITITPSSVPSGEVGVSYHQALSGNGGNGSYSWSVSAGSLPPGLTLSSSTGVLSGTPTSTTGSPYSFTISVSDTNSATGSQSFTGTVIPGPSITAPTSPLPQGTLNQIYQSLTFVANHGSGVYTWGASGLPTGLTLASTTGVLTGTPTQSGTFGTIVVTVTDSAGGTNSATYSLTVGTTPPPLSVSCIGSPNPVAIGQTVTFLAGPFGGTPTYTYSWSGTGISGTAISTTAVPSQAGTLTATINVTDSATPTANHASSTCSVTVTSAPTSTIKEFIRIGGRIIAVENH